MSRRLDRLEEALNLRLFVRGSTGLIPTETCRPILPELDIMEIQSRRILKIVGMETDELGGRVRVTVPDGTISVNRIRTHDFE